MRNHARPHCVIAGVAVGLLLYLWRASRPHAAIVGRVPETEHFRNIDRHDVFTVPHVLSILKPKVPPNRLRRR